MNAASHPGWPALIDWWFGDADAATADAVDEHLMSCDACGARVDELAALGRGVREAFAAGQVGAVLSAPFIARLKDGGRRVREYRVPLGGSVACAVAPDDEVLVTQIDAPLAGVHRLDLAIEDTIAPGTPRRLEDVPFDADAGTLLFASRLAEVRRLPSHDFVVRLIAVDGGAERELGRCSFHHRATPG